MFENRITTPPYENNGQGNGVLQETLPGTGTLPEELLREAVKAEDARARNGAAEQAAEAGPAKEGARANDEAPRAHDPASRAASAAGPERGADGRFLTGNLWP